MSCGRCGKGKGLCPLSLGLALGIVCAVAVLVESIWVMYYGMPPMMVAMHLPMPTWSSSFLHALMVLIKGFVFGFFLALVYDFFACCFKSCRKSGGEGSCGCCSPKDKGEVVK